MDLLQRCGGFEFNQECSFNQKIDAMFPNRLTPVKNWNGFLPFKFNSKMSQFESKSFFVKCFEKTWTQVRVDPNRGPNYPIGKIGVP